MQVFFTTHSQTLLEYINKRNDKNSGKERVSNHYLDNSRGGLEVRVNPTTDFIKKNLQETYSGMTRDKKITILTEDEVGRWFLNKILEKNKFKYISKITMPKISIGWEQLIKLIRTDYATFKNFMIFLDPDLYQNDNGKRLKDLLAGTAFDKYINKNNGNIFFVELGNNIESIFYEYLFDLKQNDPFFYDPVIEGYSLTSKSLINGGPFGEEYKNFKSDLDKIKYWFKNNQYIIDIAFDYWYKTEEQILDDFYKKFSTAFQRILNQN